MDQVGNSHKCDPDVNSNFGQWKFLDPGGEA